MEFYMVNLLKNKEKKYKIKDSIENTILKKSKRIKDKDNWLVQVYDGRTMYMYSIDGYLLYKEWFNGEDNKCIDYSVKDIKDGDIVYCRYDKNYYILISDNDKTKPTISKFLGLTEYPDECTLFGIPEYFVSKVSDEDIKSLKLEYLYEMRKLLKEKKYAELKTFTSNII